VPPVQTGKTGHPNRSWTNLVKKEELGGYGRPPVMADRWRTPGEQGCAGATDLVRQGGYRGDQQKDLWLRCHKSAVFLGLNSFAVRFIEQAENAIPPEIAFLLFASRIKSCGSRRCESAKLLYKTQTRYSRLFV